jgi:hypothetical protein
MKIRCDNCSCAELTHKDVNQIYAALPMYATPKDVDRTIQEFSPRLRSVAYPLLEGKSVEETAIITGLSTTNTKTLKSRLITALQKVALGIHPKKHWGNPVYAKGKKVPSMENPLGYQTYHGGRRIWSRNLTNHDKMQSEQYQLDILRMTLKKELTEQVIEQVTEQVIAEVHKTLDRKIAEYAHGD